MFTARRIQDDATWGVWDESRGEFVRQEGKPIEFSFEHNARLMARTMNNRAEEKYVEGFKHSNNA